LGQTLLVVDKHRDPVRLVNLLCVFVLTVTKSGCGTRSFEWLSELNSGRQRAAVRSTKLLGDLSKTKSALAHRSDTAGCGRQTNALSSGSAVWRGVQWTGSDSIQTARLADGRLGFNSMRRGQAAV